MRARTLAAVLAALLLLVPAGPSLAQSSPAAGDESRLELLSPHGMALTLGAGVMRFLGRQARYSTGGHAVSFYADLRAAYGTRTRFGAELGFTRAGRSSTVEQRQAGQGATFSQSFEGTLRINFPWHSGPLFHGPFVVAGLGWTDMRPEDDRDPVTRSRRIDRMGIIPVGLGLAVSYRLLHAEARVVLRPTFAENGGSPAGGRPSMAAWFAGLSVGAEL